MKKKLMFYILIFILSVAFYGCKETAPSEDATVTNEVSEVSNLSTDIEVGKAKLTWDLQNTENVDKILVFQKLSYLNSYGEPAKLKPTDTTYETELKPFIQYDLLVKLLFKDGTESEGKTISVTGKHKSVVLDNVDGRELQIYLPPSYNSSDKRYPVVYMHDGQFLFDNSTSPAGEWKVDEVLDELIEKNMIEELIVVGIYNSADRTKEYLPYYDERLGKDISPNDIKGESFAKFIVEEVIPYIDNNYRTIPDRGNRAVMGSSYGGLLSFWMGYNHFDSFSMLGALSPSLEIGRGATIRDIESQPKKDLKIWIDRGTEEWSNYDREAVDALIDKGYKYGEDILYYEVNGGEHSEKYWSQRIAYPLLMFKGNSANDIVELNLEIEVNLDYYRKNSVVEYIVNPVVKMDNGIQYSLYRLADYNIDGSKNDTIDEKGLFNIASKKDAEVIVSYKDIIKKATIVEADIEEKAARREKTRKMILDSIK